MFEGTLFTIQDIYDLGMTALSVGKRSNLERAEVCFDALVSEAPEFGEGVFQAASVKKRLGKLDDAAKLARLAADMMPDNPAYRALAKQCEAA